MNNDNDTVRVYFPATVPKDQVPFLAALLTGRDDDVLLDVERAINGRIGEFDLIAGTEFFDKVELDAPVTIDFVLREDVTLLTDLEDAR
jgi:hypothetical protein